MGLIGWGFLVAEQSLVYMGLGKQDKEMVDEAICWAYSGMFDRAVEVVVCRSYEVGVKLRVRDGDIVWRLREYMSDVAEFQEGLLGLYYWV